MSPKNKIKLNLLRKKLDKIDNNLLKIIHKRTKIVKKVLTLKSYKKEIIDKIWSLSSPRYASLTCVQSTGNHPN